MPIVFFLYNLKSTYNNLQLLLLYIYLFIYYYLFYLCILTIYYHFLECCIEVSVMTKTYFIQNCLCFKLAFYFYNHNLTSPEHLEN